MMQIKIRYADIIYDSIVDGPGLRTTLFVSGCHNHCPGCHNPLLQNPNYGSDIDIETLVDKLCLYNQDVTLSGGDPMEQAAALWHVAKELKNRNNNINIWVYSGYKYEDLIKDADALKLLEYCDVLVDGRFEIDKKSLECLFRGSTNQRLIDLKASLKQGKIVNFT